MSESEYERHKRIVSLSIALLRAEAVKDAWLQASQAADLEAKTDEVLHAALMRSAITLTNDNLRRGVELLALYKALIYAVAEKWEAWNFTDPIVDTLLTKRDNLRLLKQHRHAVFHVDVFDAKGLMDLARNSDALAWSLNLAVAFRKALVEESKKLPPWPET